MRTIRPLNHGTLFNIHYSWPFYSNTRQLASTISMSGVYVLEDLCSNKIQNKIIQKMNTKNGFTREITNEKFLERKETQGFSGKARE